MESGWRQPTGMCFYRPVHTRLSFTLVIEDWAFIPALYSLVVEVQRRFREGDSLDRFQKSFVSRLLCGQF